VGFFVLFVFLYCSLTQQNPKVDERAAVGWRRAEEDRLLSLEQKETADVHPVRPQADRRDVSTSPPHI